MSDVIRPVDSERDIPQHLRGTPLDDLLQYQNLGRELRPVPAPQLLIGMCMDSRKHLRIPDNFAFILRAGGALVVTQVSPDGPAYQKLADASSGYPDIILKVNKDALSRLQPIRHFRQLVVDLEPGSEVTLEILRGEERQHIAVKIGKRPAHLP